MGIEEFFSFYRSPNTVRMIKFRTLMWTRHTARLREDRSALKILTGKPTDRKSIGSI